VQTFPVYIYVAAQRGIPPQANVIASAVFLIAIAATLVFQVVSARRAGRLKR
jgi:spermidine/putrescine transport system permease protein